MNASIARMIFRLWPFPFGHDRLMEILNPAQIPMATHVSMLKDFPVSLKYDPNSYIGRYIYYRGIFEEQIIRKIRSVTAPGMTFLDIGANIGLHTTIAASLVGENGKVIAVEPQTSVFTLLKENIALNNLRNVETLNCALSNQSGTARIFMVNERNNGQSTLNPGDGARICPSEEVAVQTLDSMLATLGIASIDVMKIDVEGAEMDVLEGGKSLFSKSPPRILFIECIDQLLRRFGASSEKLLYWLNTAGYRTYAIYRGRWIIQKPATGLHADLMAVWGM